MTILTRISRLVKSDLHGILDVLEDPQAVLKQALREMEMALESEKAALEEAKTIEQRTATTIQLLEISREQTAAKISFCFESGQESLARSFVRRKLETERRIAAHERDIQALQREQVTIEKRIAAQEEELKRVQEKAALITEVAETEGGISIAAMRNDESGVSEEDVEIAFIAEKKRREQSSSVSG